MMKRSLGQQIFFAIFGTFGRYVTNLRGTFVENVKKVQDQPTLVAISRNKFSQVRSEGGPDFTSWRRLVDESQLLKGRSENF
jgi:hypothetical protein